MLEYLLIVWEVAKGAGFLLLFSVLMLLFLCFVFGVPAWAAKRFIQGYSEKSEKARRISKRAILLGLKIKILLAVFFGGFLFAAISSWIVPNSMAWGAVMFLLGAGVTFFCLMKASPSSAAVIKFSYKER